MSYILQFIDSARFLARFNSHLNKLKVGIKNGTEVTLKLSSNVVGDSNDENNFSHKLLFTNT